MKCSHCGSKVDARYKINGQGDVFCDDECYAEFMDEHDEVPSDHDHPYIDDYDAIRFEYIEWLDNWESDLLATIRQDRLLKISEMVDSLDSYVDEYLSYYLAEGDDGFFAQEIYQYLLKFRTMQLEMLQWRPAFKWKYYFTFQFDQEAFGEEPMYFKKFAKFLRERGLKNLAASLKRHVYSSDYPYRLYFEYQRKNDRDNALNRLREHFPTEMIDIRTGLTHPCTRCDTNHVYMEEDQPKASDDWGFCPVCEKLYYPGFFSKEELHEEIQFHEKWKNLKKHSKEKYWPYYLRKIKRSCCLYHWDYPDWIELNYYIK